MTTPTTTVRRTGPEQWFHTTATICMVQLLVCLWPAGWYVLQDLTVEANDGVGLWIAAAMVALLLVLAALVLVAVVLERRDRRWAARWTLLVASLLLVWVTPKLTLVVVPGLWWVLAPLVALTGVACAVVGLVRLRRDRL